MLTLILTAGLAAWGSAPAYATTACGATPFGTIGTAWGTPGSPTSAGPGDRDVPLTVSLLFYGPCTDSASSFTLTLPAPFSAVTGKDTATVYQVDVAPDTILQETFYLNINSSAALKAYSLPLSINYQTPSNSTTSTESTQVSIALKGDVKLSFTSPTDVLYSGQLNDVEVTVSNVGTGNATSLDVSVTPSAQISTLTGPTAISELSAGKSVTQSLQIFVPQSSSGSTASLTFTTSYYNSYSTSQTSTQVLDFEVASVNPASPYVVEGAEWGTSSSSPKPGDENVPVVVSLEYMGTALVTDLRGTLGMPPGFTASDGGSNATASVSVVTPNEVLQLTFYVDVGSSVAPAAYAFPLSLEWDTATSVNATQTASVSPPAVGQQASPSPAPYLSQLTNTVIAGTPSTVTFVLSNDGSASMYSVVFSINVGSPLVVMGNSPSAPLAVVQPGHNATYAVSFGSSPDSSLGVYSGTVTVTYTNIDGTQQMQTFSVGLTLTGSIQIVVQDETVSQSSSGLTVSGSLLNEGSSSAYYLQVGGKVDNSSSAGETADYVGEVDPNTPTPFTVTIPYPAPSSPQPHAQIELDITFQNSFGTSATSSSSSSESLESASQLSSNTGTSSSHSSSSGQGLVTIVSYSIVAVFVVAAAVAAVVVGRKRAAMKPKKEDKVI